MSTRYFVVPYDPPYVGYELIAEHQGRLPSKFISKGGLPPTAIEITREQYSIRKTARADEIKLVDGVPIVMTDEEKSQTRTENYFPQEIQKKIKEIDEKTKILITKGFGFEGDTFSLSLEAQTNWKNLDSVPVIVSTKDSKEYVITSEEELLEFKAAYKDRLNECLESGRLLKLLVNSAEDVSALSQIVDGRD